MQAYSILLRLIVPAEEQEYEEGDALDDLSSPQFNMRPRPGVGHAWDHLSTVSHGFTAGQQIHQTADQRMKVKLYRLGLNRRDQTQREIAQQQL